MFSAVLGLAGSAIGAIGANRRASAQLAQQQYQFDRQMELQNLQMGMAIDAQRQQAEENAYRRQIEQMNRLIAQQERTYQMGQVEQQRETLMAERREMIERQIQEDREAARQRQFQLEQLLQNQDLRAEEREFAIQQLEQARAVAEGERDEDMRRFLEERAQAEIERDFVLGEYQQARAQAAAEREQDLEIRRMILAQTGQLQDALTGTAAELGFVPEIPQITEADIAAEIERRSGQYTADVDRAADRVASVNEADLIRAGVDESTTGTARRADIAARLAQEYQNARQRAYDDALNYISGRSSTLSSNVNDIMQRRSAILGETADIAGAGINVLRNLPGVQSAVGVYDMARAVPSAVYTRGISSANDFRAPVQIGSAIYDGINVPVGMAAYRTPSSTAVTTGLNVGSAIYNPMSMTIDNPSTYMSNAGTLGNQLLSSSTTMANQAMSDAYSASSGFGQDFRDFFNTRPITGYNDQGNPTYGQSPGQRLDSWFSNTFFGGGS